MGNHSIVAGAPDRLAKAFEVIETNLEEGHEVEDVLTLLRDEIVALTSDRERLQEELEAAEQNARRLKEANEDVSNRINHVIKSIRKVMKESE